MIAVLLLCNIEAAERKDLPNAAATNARFAIPATDEGLPGSGPIRRYEWFQKLWSDKRSGWAQRVQQDKGAVVFLGDSITQGWGDDLKGAFPGMKIANRGISGDTTRGVLIRLKDDVLSLKPKAVLLLIGTNDLEEGADPETIAANLKLIVKALRKHNSKMPIIVSQVFPSSATKKRPSDKIQRINDLYAQILIGEKQIHMVPTYPLFANQSGDAKADEFPDLLHPNNAGYTKWAEALEPTLVQLGLFPPQASHH